MSLDDDDDCWMPPAILAPVTPHPSPTQHPHATLPVAHTPDTPAVVGIVLGIVVALAVLSLAARCAVRRRRPWRSKRRLSDESWVSPALGTPDAERRLVSRPAVPPVRVPSPVYFSPCSPSPSVSSSSTDTPARLSRLLSSTFSDTPLVASPARPTTAHLVQTARAYAHAYRPISPASPSLYARTSFDRVRDTLSTVTTTDTISPFADPDDRPAGTPLGLKLRLSDASEHARYRLRERERERRRADEFKLRDSESVLREIGW